MTHPSERKATRIGEFRKILSEHQAARIDGYLVDHFSASAVVQIYDHLSPANQEKLMRMPIWTMMTVVWRLVKKYG